MPVQVRGGLQDRITVNPGDTVVADDDGVIVIPQAMLAEVVLRATAWANTESGARDEIREGMPLLQALEKYGHL
jgi:regulator of RNase E activity RraA